MKTEIFLQKEIDDKFLQEIEKNLDVKIYKNANSLNIESEDGYKLLKAKEIIDAYIFGFNEEECRKLFNENFRFQIIEIKNFLRNKNNRNRLKELKGRVIGEKGKAKRNIEELTKSKIIIRRNIIGIISSEENYDLVRRAIEMILEGRMHSTVYSFIIKELQKRKNII
ncbi:MAG: hypothetical protein QW678_01615 [Candidatus Aenigmatarchaeota archaeon]